MALIWMLVVLIVDEHVRAFTGRWSSDIEHVHRWVELTQSLESMIKCIRYFNIGHCTMYSKMYKYCGRKKILREPKKQYFVR